MIPIVTAKNTHAVQTLVFSPLKRLVAMTAAKTIV